MKLLAMAVMLGASLGLSGTASDKDRLVAIDVLLEPDARMMKAASEWNARLKEQMPEGFSLDETHRPHITLLQLYVSKEELPAVIDKVEALASAASLDDMKLVANGLYHIPSGEIGLQGITIEPSDEIRALQSQFAKALAPYRKHGGEQDAFVPDPSGAPFDPFLFTYVDRFFEDGTGDRYNPHVTTGAAPLAWVEAREREAFEPFEFGVTGLAVYRLGNFGTAAQRLSN